jgi:IS30 family transposase
MMINQRNRIGDFELDTVVGPRGHSKAILLTLIDRKSRFLWAYRLKDRTTATVNEHRGTFTSGTSIEQRPTIVNQRLAFGHWEVDTVLSGRKASRACLVTFVERKTRLLWAIKAPNRTAKALNSAFEKFMGTFGSQVKSITVDHGKEFADYQSIEQDYQIKVYFCHPYSPWERGSNEYFNRRLRWFFPKKTNFGQVTTDEILAALELINQRPLKIHHQQTAIESFRACSD